MWTLPQNLPGCGEPDCAASRRSQMVMVGDRGMITSARIDKLRALGVVWVVQVNRKA